MAAPNGEDLNLYDVSEATIIIYEAAGEGANVIFGAVIDENLNDEIFITLIATGFNADEKVVSQLSREVEAAAGNFKIPTYIWDRKKKEAEESHKALGETPRR